MSEEKVFFTNTKGDRLCGVLSVPAPDAPVVVMAHGFGSRKDARSYTTISEKLFVAGIGSFCFDFYGCGESEGKFENITLSEAVDDVLCAIQFVRKKGYSKLGLLGSSFGGLASLVAASQCDHLSVLALKAPVSKDLGVIIARLSSISVADWKKNGFAYYTNFKGKKLKLNYEFYNDAQKVDGIALGKNIKITTIIVHGTADQSVPLEQSIALASAIRGSVLHIIKGAVHRFLEPAHFEECMATLANFLAEELKK